MPKGDRLKLKADPEDGTTPISNLLLEAVAMAKLPGIQIKAILYLWRKTYGWVGKDGKRKKKCEIGLKEWSDALNVIKSSAATALSELEQKNIISRTTNKQWGTYDYQVNTHIHSWNSNCIDFERLAKMTQYAKTEQSSLPVQYGETVQLSETVPTVRSDRTLQYGETVHPTIIERNIKESIKKEGDVKLTSPQGIKVKEVFARLDKLRGYRPPKRKAEAASILRMLKTYTPDQIIETWQKIKQDKFWQDKELFMMTVESQIGAVLNTKTNQPAEKYSHMVKHDEQN